MDFSRHGISLSLRRIIFKSFPQKLQVEASEVQNALHSDDPHNQLAIAYHLIVDNKRFVDVNTMYRFVS